MRTPLPSESEAEGNSECERMFCPYSMDGATIRHIPVERRFYVNAPLGSKLVLHSYASTHAPLQRRYEMPVICAGRDRSDNILFVCFTIDRYLQTSAQRRIYSSILDIKPLIRHMQRYSQIMHMLGSLDIISILS